MDLTTDIANELFDILKNKALLSEDKAGAVSLALLDISGSTKTIFSVLVPKILDKATSREEIKEVLWDIRDEFRHIQYHIDDAKLAD